MELTPWLEEGLTKLIARLKCMVKPSAASLILYYKYGDLVSLINSLNPYWNLRRQPKVYIHQ